MVKGMFKKDEKLSPDCLIERWVENLIHSSSVPDGVFFSLQLLEQPAEQLE